MCYTLNDNRINPLSSQKVPTKVKIQQKFSDGIKIWIISFCSPSNSGEQKDNHRGISTRMRNQYLVGFISPYLLELIYKGGDRDKC